MLVLIGCEESQVVCKAFRNAGHEAYSCDLQPTRGNPEWHFQQDIMQVIPARRWDLIILHPDCTAMAVSGNRWYGKAMSRHAERQAAILWTLELWEMAKKHSDRVALENPVSVIFKHLPNVHYIQPYEHGHGETKKTGFALHNLEPLQPTNKVDGREQRTWKMGPSPTRKRDRSKTFDGVARAMVLFWA
ncbi:MAG: DNA cytosine methyltransferase [Chlamydiota bacterium]|nr:DNA cytosine methyltransferase [Chlamydiota bacterium]